jgi:hypothetical protein
MKSLWQKKPKLQIMDVFYSNNKSQLPRTVVLTLLETKRERDREKSD